MKEENKPLLAIALLLAMIMIIAIVASISKIKYVGEENIKIEERNELLREKAIKRNIINQSSFDTKMEVNRQIEIKLDGTFCVKGKNLNSCYDLDRLKEFTNHDYNEKAPYYVLFDYTVEPSTVYIVNNDFLSNPEIMVVGSGESIR